CLTSRDPARCTLCPYTTLFRSSGLVSGGVETVVGVAHDDLFGPVVMFGLGGVFVEVLGDVTFRVPPFGWDQARRMLDELKGSTLDRKSTRLNSSHGSISYAVFC